MVTRRVRGRPSLRRQFAGTTVNAFYGSGFTAKPPSERRSAKVFWGTRCEIQGGEGYSERVARKSCKRRQSHSNARTNRRSMGFLAFEDTSRRPVRERVSPMCPVYFVTHVPGLRHPMCSICFVTASGMTVTAVVTPHRSRRPNPKVLADLLSLGDLAVNSPLSLRTAAPKALTGRDATRDHQTKLTRLRIRNGRRTSRARSRE